MGRWVEAKRDGKCGHCPRAITAGDEIWVKSAGVSYCQDCGLLAENVPHECGELETSIMKELAKLPMEAGEGVLAQSMIMLARQLDDGDVPPRERPQYTKELRISLLTLQDAYPATDDEDETETARQKRERRARESGSGY
ncbi:MAG TPA: hypothetical protein VGG75_14420 [Trebonia sp.]|jgi:hypothetical protein